MTRARTLCASLTLSLALAGAQPAAAQTPALRVVNSGPRGELAAVEQANEIRVVFSEPMVTLGRIPTPVTAPFLRMAPAVAGTYRWSGTTTLIFTPDPARPLPFATTYQVTVDPSATAVSGRRLAAPVTFRFTTPTVRLLQTSWYRRGGTVATPLVVALRFNQPVRPPDVLAHLTAALTPHDFDPPAFTEEEQARLTAEQPDALAAFTAKVAAVRRTAGGTEPVPVRLATTWDRQRFPPSPDLVVVEAAAPVLPESWVRLALDARLPSPAGPATPGTVQQYTVEAEPAFFFDGFSCARECDGDDRNPLRSRAPVNVKAFAAAIRVMDITAAPQPVRKPARAPARPPYADEDATFLTLEDAGYAAQPPDRKYAVSAPATLASADGQTLGYPWVGIVDNWHMTGFTSFGDGHGVWEQSSGPQLPFYARNLRSITQWIFALDPANLMPTLRDLMASGFRREPPVQGTARRLTVTADRVQSHGLDVTRALSPGGTGLVWAAVRDGDLLARTHRADREGEPTSRASIVQVTNLGLTVKDSPQNTLVFVTRLDTGAPVAGATVSIVRLDNTTAWRGTTGADGVAIAPATPLRAPDQWYDFSFLVTAEKDGDIAYVGSDWNEGISPWEFGTGLNLRERDPLLRGSVFTDRGVYRLGETVQFKAILRQNGPDGVRLLPEGTPVFVSVRDAQNKVVDERTVPVTSWSSAEWTLPLSGSGTLGDYSVRAILAADRPAPKPPERRQPGVEPGPDDDDYVAWERAVHGSFLVAAYRRPDFRVDVSLTGQSLLAGDALRGVVTGRYLFGAPMGGKPVTWRFSKSPGYGAPDAITERFGEDRWVFVGTPSPTEGAAGRTEIGQDQGTLAATGDLPLSLDTEREAGIPFIYSLEGDVEDVSRQHIANRASLTVHPAPWYVGLRRPSYFLNQAAGLDTEIVAAGLNGQPVAGVPVTLTLTQVQWTSVRRAEGNGFYTWDTQRKDVPAGSWTVTTADAPVPLSLPLTSGGYYVLEARGQGEDGRSAVTRTAFYVLGEGYTAWQRFDHNRIDLVPERQTYRPGDTARIMIQSPWEQATALVTTEREGVRSHRQFALTSTQQSISVPISEDDIPNVFVSVLLVKGRTAAAPANASATRADADTSDPGKPAFRLGYVELKVEDRAKRLSVKVTADREEYRPAAKATVHVDVRDMGGAPAASEVTLWAVDYGVLSLTGYQPPDVSGSVYVRKALQVLNEDSRQRIVSRRVLTPKGGGEGGGGGSAAGAGTLRRDFRVLAFWVGSVVTGPDGRATVDITLPESLTTYRVMAVAGDRRSRFGSGSAEVRTNKPVTMTAAFPRFLAVGDSAVFGAVVGSQLPADGTAVVTMRSLDPSVFTLQGPAEQRVRVGAGGTVEVRFPGTAKSVGRARLQMTAAVGTESDAFEDVLPVEVLASPETVAAYGEAADATTAARETLTIPSGVVPGLGGLDVELSSTAMVGLGEGARYLVEYPYGCAEQRASTSLALVLAGDLGEAFSLPGLTPAAMREAAQRTVKELETYQCENGGFAYWPGACWTVSPYLTAYVLHVFKTAGDLGYDVDRGVTERAFTYLERALAERPPTDNEAWWPAYTAWQAFAVKVLAEAGRTADAHVTRLYGYRDRMPVFALAYLHDALLARGETSGARADDLRRRMANAILPEGGSAHVGELADPYLLWFWNSNVRSTAIVLNSLVKAKVADAPIRELVRWMMAARRNGRWGNTQENAHALESLVAYYRTYDAAAPDFRATVRLGARQIARDEFRGRSTEASRTTLPMAQVLAAGPAGRATPLTFTREGAGTLFYATRLRYAVDALFQDGLDSGFSIERRYEPYVETGPAAPATSYAAGDLVRVTLTFRLTKERRYVAVTDPLPAGFEAVESWFATTASDLAAAQDRQANEGGDASDWRNWWRFSGFDRVERHDDRVQLFATRLAEGVHTFSYIVRATTAGSFRTAPARAEEMYEPEVFGRTGTTVVEVKR
ncbi:MAG: MG2 domain-containing protein [Vicinamibacterales bacterium]